MGAAARADDRVRSSHRDGHHPLADHASASAGGWKGKERRIPRCGLRSSSFTPGWLRSISLQARMAELEERVDFTERLLAQNREPDRLQR